MDNYGQFFDYLPFNFGIVLDQPVISSTLLLTLLLMVGLFFFIQEGDQPSGSLGPDAFDLGDRVNIGVA